MMFNFEATPYIPQGTVDKNLGPDRLAGPKALDSNFCRQDLLFDCTTFVWKSLLCMVMSCYSLTNVASRVCLKNKNYPLIIILNRSMSRHS